MRASFVIIIQNSSSLSKKRQIRSCSGQAIDSAFFILCGVPSSKRHRVGEERLTGMSHGSTAGAASDSCAVTISIRIKKTRAVEPEATKEKLRRGGHCCWSAYFTVRSVRLYYNFTSSTTLQVFRPRSLPLFWHLLVS